MSADAFPLDLVYVSKRLFDALAYWFTSNFSCDEQNAIIYVNNFSNYILTSVLLCDIGVSIIVL